MLNTGWGYPDESGEAIGRRFPAAVGPGNEGHGLSSPAPSGERTRPPVTGPGGREGALPPAAVGKVRESGQIGHGTTETLKGGKVSPEARVLGFVILMVAIFLGAYKAGAFLGPVIPAHSAVSTPGGGQAPSMNMNMGVGPAQPVGRLRAPAGGSPATGPLR